MSEIPLDISPASDVTLPSDIPGVAENTTATPSTATNILLPTTSTQPVLAISTNFPLSTSSTLPASTLPAPSTSVFPTIHPTSPTPQPGGLSTSAKIGIGVGVPLGVIVLAIVALLGYLYGKRKGAKKNAIPAAEEQFHGFPGDKDPSTMQEQGEAGTGGPQEVDDMGELPRYAEELQGSPGVKRHELPAQREAMGYFSPKLVTS